MPDRVTVDMVTHDPTTDELVLYVVADGPWPQSDHDYGAVLKSIQDKILDVVDASIDGGIAAVYPDSLGKRIRIQVDSPNGCPERLDHLIKRIDSYLVTSDEYTLAIQRSRFLSGLRIVSGQMMGRFKQQS